MILNIDTNEESPQRLRQIAAFLEQLAGEKSSVSTPVVEQQETSSQAFDMFDMSSDAPQQVSEKPSESSKKDDDDDVFRMIPY